jgi:HAMP domain-containing protein
MGLRTKFNIAIVTVFLLGFVITAFLLNRNFEASARAEAIENARIMMSAANAIRSYTATRIVPLTGFERDGKFLAESVPAFAAQTNFHAVSQQFPSFRYKEAALNPTNLDDRATDWEADIIHAFRQSPADTEIISERETPFGPSVNLSHPIAIKDAACLICHSVPEAAPASMTKQYGTANGFGWHQDEVIGAQIVSLPLSVPLAKAHQTLVVFLSVLTAIFISMLVILNILLNHLVIRPVVAMSRIATDVSLGNSSAPMFEATGHDEISALSEAFNRMRRSLQSALSMLENEHDES